MRIPLATDLSSRTGAVTKDSKVQNGLVEGSGEQAYVRKRPGTQTYQAFTAGQAQLLTNFDGDPVAVIGDNLSYIDTYPVPDIDPNAASVWVGFDFEGADGSTTITPIIDPDSYDVVGTAAIDTDVSIMFDTSLAIPTVTSKIKRATADSYLDMGSGDFTIEGKFRLSALPTGAGVVFDISRDLGGTFAHVRLYITSNGAFFHAVANTAGDNWASNIGTSAGVIAINTTYHFAFVRNGTSFKTYIDGVFQTAANFTHSGAIYYYVAGEKLAVGGPVLNGGSEESMVGWVGGIRLYKGLAKYTGNFTAPTTYYTSQDIPSSALSPLTANLQFSAQQTGPNAAETLLMLKNRQQAWVMDDSGTVTAVSDSDYPGNYQVEVTSLTRSGTVATATVPYDVNFQVGSTVTIAGATPTDYNGSQVITAVTDSSAPDVTVGTIVTISRSGTTATATCVSEPHGLVNGQSITISGANQSQYNGTHTITWVSDRQFSYTVSVTAAVDEGPASPATGSISVTVSNDIGPLTTNGQAWHENYTIRVEAAVDYLTGIRYYHPGDSIVLGGAIVGTYVLQSVSQSTYYGSVTLSMSFVSGTAGAGGYVSVTTASAAISNISITRVGTVATLTYRGGATPTQYGSVTVSGCDQSEYNQTFNIGSSLEDGLIYTVATTSASNESPVTPATGTIRVNPKVLSGASFTFTIAGSPVTPATGTITATAGRNTVPGIVYLDGSFYVMDVFGVIYNCAIDDPQSWNALDFLTAQNEPGRGVALAKSYNYVVAFKEWSTEFFYNAGNPEGSPLSRVDNGFTLIGCASGQSVANLDGALFWLSQVRQQGRGVHLMQGTEQSRISTPDIDRILNADDLSEVYAYGMKVEGHALYVLTLTNSAVTLVFDMTSKVWTQWTSLSLNASTTSVTSITQTGGVATLTISGGHGVTDGNPIYIAGASQSAYNGIKQARVVSSTVLQFDVSSATVTPATGTITLQKYDSSYFNLTHYAYANEENLALHETSGTIYSMGESDVSDNGVPIDLLIRTSEFDNGSTDYKVMRKIEVIGNKVDSSALIRWTDDDYVSYSTFRVVDLDQPRSQIRRCGNFRRRAFEVRHTDAVEVQLTGLEV